jgi:glycosyltransferase involved in cell wall biosynthesis
MPERSNPWLSIITVCLNDCKNLIRTLQSIRDQKCPYIQCILVDGDSIDDTKTVIESNLDVITDWISEKDKGLYDAMNKGMQMAKGEYILFLNAGDVFHDTQVVSYAYEHHAMEDILYGDAIFVHEDGTYKSPRHKVLPTTLDLRSFKNGMVVCHQALFVKSSVAATYNLKYKIAADLDWAIRSIKIARNTRYLGITVCDFQAGGLSSRRRRLALIERWKILSGEYGWFETMRSHLIMPVKFALWKVSSFLKINLTSTHLDTNRHIA